PPFPYPTLFRSTIVGGHVVVHGRDRQLGPPHPASREPQPLERLGRRHLVNQVQVHIQELRSIGEPVDDVGGPDFVEQRSRLHARRGSGLGARDSELGTRASFPSPESRTPSPAFPSSDHGIIARSVAPTCSIRWSFCSRRMRWKLGPPWRLSSIHSRAKAPLWISARICCIRARTAGVMSVGPRV